MLQGTKTYIVVAIAILTALIGLLGGEITLFQALQAVGIALGVAGNRSVLKLGEFAANRFGSLPGEAERKLLLTYLGVALAILTAVLATMNGQQDLVVTVSVILNALGLNFLGRGAKKAVASA